MKASKFNKADKKKKEKENFSPVCFADSEEVRPEFKEDQKPVEPAKKGNKGS